MNILLIIGAIIVLVIIIGLFMKRSFTVERSIVVERPVAQVFDYVKHICNQDQFSPWSMMDPAMKKTYTGTDGTVGFIYAWKSELKRGPGKGEQEIKGIEENKRLNLELRFLEPFSSVAPAWFLTEPTTSNSTRVTWGIHCEMKFPMNLMGLFVSFDKVMGKQFDSGLGLLKSNLEK